MKQKVVIKIQMHCDKCRNKALKTAAEVQGVTMVSLEGDEKDRVVVTGDNINTIYLINQLNKKFKCVTVVSIEEVKKPPEKKPEEKKDDKKKDDKKKEEQKPFCAVLCLPSPPHAQCSHCQTKCEHCSKCEGPKCQCKCILVCFKCNNPKCDGKCNICIKCESPKCSGHCCSSHPKPPTKPEPKPDSKPSEQPKPQPQPQPQPIFINCPPWCNCSSCYVPYNCRVVYESNPDSCSIM